MAPEASAPDISVKGLTKRYGEVVAVDGIDLEISAGEFFTMLGPSGSGKTTTLRMIAGFETPDSGTIELAGEDVSRLPPYDRPVNTVFQDYALFPHMTVLQNVEYGLMVKKVKKGERGSRAADALEMVRLGGYGDRKPSQLSGGQRQRVALARAIVNRPKVLLLDEPLGALDLKLRQEMQIELKSIQREVGITFVYVTHDQEEALTMSDRLAVFNQGRIEQIGPPAEVYEHPESEFIAGFVGVSNVIERDGRRYTVRPEKINLLMDGEERQPARRSSKGTVRDVAVRRSGDAVSGHARPGWRAPGAGTEPRRRLERGARGERTPGVARVAPGTGVRDRRIRGRIRMRRRRMGCVGGAGDWSSRALSVVAAGCGGGSDGSSASTEIEGLGSTLEEIQANAKDGGGGRTSLGRLRRGRLRRQVDWVDRLREGDRLQGETQDGARRPTTWSTLIATGQYDGVSASGDATLRLVAGRRRRAGELRPDPELRGHLRGLEEPAVQHGRRRGYGVPHGRGANVLMWRTDTVLPATRQLER